MHKQENVKQAGSTRYVRNHMHGRLQSRIDPVLLVCWGRDCALDRKAAQVALMRKLLRTYWGSMTLLSTETLKKHVVQEYDIAMEVWHYRRTHEPQAEILILQSLLQNSRIPYL